MSDKSTRLVFDNSYPLNIQIIGKGSVEERVLKEDKHQNQKENKVELIISPEPAWKLVGWYYVIDIDKMKRLGRRDVTLKFRKLILFLGGSTVVKCHTLIEVKNGGFIVSGNTRSCDGDFAELKKHNSISLFTIKVSPEGETEWVKKHGGRLTDNGTSAYPTNDGGHILTGSTRSYDGDFQDLHSNIGQNHFIFVIKFNPLGEKEWIRTYGGRTSDSGKVGDVANAIIQTSDSGYILTGKSTSDNGEFKNKKIGYADLFVMKLNSLGDPQWIKTFGGSDEEEGKSIVQLDDGNFVVVGRSISNDGYFHENNDLGSLVLMKLDSMGNVLWKHTYGGSGLYEVCNSIVNTKDGGFIITGATNSNDGDFSAINNSSISSDLYVFKFDMNGKKECVNTYNLNGGIGNAIIQTNDLGYIITGYCNSKNKNLDGKFINRDLVVIKINVLGEPQWIKVFGGSKIDRGSSVVQLKGGDILVAGKTVSYDGDFNRKNDRIGSIFMMKLNSLGDLIPF